MYKRLSCKHDLSTTFQNGGQVIMLILAIILLAGCSTRDLDSALTGSTAQRLVTHSIDDLISDLPEEEFEAYRGGRLYLNTHFVEESGVKHYADSRLKHELEQRFGITVVDSPDEAEYILSVFYTSLATDHDNFGISLHLGYIPGFDDSSRLNILTLEKFHGIAEMYYYVGEADAQARSKVMQARTKTDALGLPFITIPLSNVDRDE